MKKHPTTPPPAPTHVDDSALLRHSSSSLMLLVKEAAARLRKNRATADTPWLESTWKRGNGERHHGSRY
ncbi:hypothetical protein [Xylophilus sp. GOD-11R]|uniref:hypothetical protein n=1 Tax=Xylophilus sp. GOD-11R TaxID=3089814 RepID=UPI00298BD333|nr:hypothetical protein [Xylophilus sp. GOD-11R]WPB55320.1 hypothetical protein R9X41_14325 [Xylophilus sp. GOD-11R]